MRDCRSGDISFPGEGHHYVICTIDAHGVEFDLPPPRTCFRRAKA